jgi:asparagine synthase (glutamine-hydrolysing)
VLNGQGGDELFGGYTNHYYLLFGELFRKGRMRALLQEIALFKKYRGVPFMQLLVQNFVHIAYALRTSNYFNRATFSEVRKSALREYLKYDDRLSMAFGIEARAPFLYYRLVEIAFSLDEQYKIKNGINKYLVRRYAKGMVPEAIVQRRDKMGFTSPQEVWQKQELKPYFDRTFSDIEKLENLGISTKQIEEFYQGYTHGKNVDGWFIWRFFCLYHWARFHKIF